MGEKICYLPLGCRFVTNVFPRSIHGQVVRRDQIFQAGQLVQNLVQLRVFVHQEVSVHGITGALQKGDNSEINRQSISQYEAFILLHFS